MTRAPRKSVSGRLAAAVLFAAVVPTVVHAAPILNGSTTLSCPSIDDGGTGGVVPTTTSSCSFADLGDPLLGSLMLTGEFTADQDVALFQFVLETTAFLSASASDDGGLTVFDPFIGLFYASTGESVRYFDTELGDITDARNDDIAPDNFNALIPTIQLEAGTYILALLQTGNTFSAGLDGIDSLSQGFAWDSADPASLPGTCAAAGSCAFSVGLTATAPSASVPEPGTLTLMALGAGVAAFARRRRVRH